MQAALQSRNSVLDNPIFTRVVRDDDERAAGRQPVAHRGQRVASSPRSSRSRRSARPETVARTPAIRCADQAPHGSRPTRSSLVSNGRFSRRRTISRASRAPRGSSPNSLKMPVSVDSFSSFRIPAASVVASRPIRMSRRAPGRKVKPRSIVVDLVRRNSEVEQDSVESPPIEFGQSIHLGVVRLDGRKTPGRRVLAQARAWPRAIACGIAIDADDRRRRRRRGAPGCARRRRACRRGRPAHSETARRPQWRAQARDMRYRMPCLPSTSP